MTTLDLVYQKVLELEEAVRNLPSNLRVINASQIMTDSLSAITANLGVVRAGEIMSPNYVSGVSGFRITATGGVAYFAGDAVTLNDTGLNLYNLANSKKTALLASSGDLWIGSDISLYSGVSLISFANAQTYNGEAMGVGDLLVGDSSTGLANIFWDRSLGQFKLRSGTTDVIVLDAASPGSIRSGNFSSGIRGFKITSVGDAEFNNVRARGEMVSTVFKYNEIAATAGTLGVFLSASTLFSDFTTPSAIDGYGTMDVKNTDAGARLFSVYDVIRLKSWNGTAVKDAWLLVTGYISFSDYTVYDVQLKSGNTLATFVKGTAIADYGPSGAGAITLSADGAVGSSANMTNQTHAGSPWSAQTIRLRLGNMRDSYNTGANDRYGFGVGEYSTGNYLSYNAEGADSFVLSGGGGKLSISGLGINFVDTNSSDAVSLRWYYPYLGTNRLIGRTIGDYAGSGDAVMWLTASRLTGDPWSTDRVVLRASDTPGGTEARIDVISSGAIEFNANLDFSSPKSILWYSSSDLMADILPEYADSKSKLWFRAWRQTGDPWTSGSELLFRAIDSVASTEGQLSIGSNGVTTSSGLSITAKLPSASDPATPGLNVDDGVSGASTDARFGNALPLYIIHNSPIVGFNQYYDGTNWKYGKGSNAVYAGRLSFAPATGLLHWKVSNSTGNGDATITTENTLLNISQAGDVYTVAFTDYAGTSTIVGWSTTGLTKKIYYKKIGDLVFVQFYIEGTSNSTSTSFTLPYNFTNATGLYTIVIIRVTNNGTDGAGEMYIQPNTNTVVCRVTPGGADAGWTATGTKRIGGEFFYEV